MMKVPVVLIGAAIFGCAVAHAEPTGAADPVGDDSAFLAELQHAGISYPGDDGAVEAGKTVCRLANNGETALQVLNDLRAADPELSLQGAAAFVTIAARTYCPHQLDALGS